MICVGTTSCRTIESASDENGILKAGSGWTDIFIYPGYQFKILDCLITNFHLPESTLVMLVSALAGREHVLAAYEEAVKERYRFFSFGEMCIRDRGKDVVDEILAKICRIPRQTVESSETRKLALLEKRCV